MSSLIQVQVKVFSTWNFLSGIGLKESEYGRRKKGIFYEHTHINGTFNIKTEQEYLIMRVDNVNQRACAFLSIFIYSMSLLLSICARWCICQQSEEASISTLNFFFTLTHLSLPFSTSIT